MDVWVYQYRYWDADAGQMAVSRDYFTLDAIRTGLGVPVVESGIKANSREVDDNGRLKRVVNH